MDLRLPIARRRNGRIHEELSAGQRRATDESALTSERAREFAAQRETVFVRTIDEFERGIGGQSSTDGDPVETRALDGCDDLAHARRFAAIDARTVDDEPRADALPTFDLTA